MLIFAAWESSGCAVAVTVVLCTETFVIAPVELTVELTVELSVELTVLLADLLGVMETDDLVVLVGNAEVMTVAPASRRAGPASNSIVGSEQHS